MRNHKSQFRRPRCWNCEITKIIFFIQFNALPSLNFVFVICIFAFLAIVSDMRICDLNQVIIGISSPSQTPTLFLRIVFVCVLSLSSLLHFRSIARRMGEGRRSDCSWCARAPNCALKNGNYILPHLHIHSYEIISFLAAYNLIFGQYGHGPLAVRTYASLASANEFDVRAPLLFKYFHLFTFVAFAQHTHTWY